MTNTKSITRELVKDSVHYKLQRAGFENFTGGELIISLSSSSQASATVKRTLRLMGDEFTKAYFQAFDEMTNNINIHGGDLKEVLYNILDITCDTGIEWGRIVGIFVFTALLAVKAMDCERTDVVENLIQWTSDYLEDSRFSNWINQHGGWDGFVQFYKNPKARNQDIHHPQFWTQAYSVGINVFSKMASVANILMH